MNIEANRFASAMTVADYMAQMWEHRAEFAENYERAEIDEADVLWFRQHGPLKVLALVEDWCTDAFTHLPPLARLAEQVGSEAMELRVLYYDDNPDLAAEYRKGGVQRAIPVFVLLDAELNERGRFFERPAQFARDLNQAQAEFLAAHPEYALDGERAAEANDAIGDVRLAYRREHRGDAARMLFAELRQLLT